ncbi:hypothetical protein K474DRAFT_1384871 [Panus rudis PR-1116 ss-1]|nr:hypothetical protein K474DRAFT_1384871 [Panus rudis PR-1116 ss-1]
MKYIDSSSSPITSPTSPTFSSSLSSTLTSPNPFDGDMGITRATQAVVAPSATPSSHTDCRLEITSLGNQALDVRSTDANGPPSLDDENTPGELMGDLQARVVQDQLQSAVDTPSPGEVTSSGEHTDVLVPRLDSDTVEKDANSINVPITERVDTLDTHLDTVIQDVNSVIEPISERIDTLVAPVDTVSQDVNNVNTSITEGLDTIVQEVKNISLRASDRPMSLTQAVTNHGNRIDVLSTHLQTIEEHVGGAERRVGNVTTDN